MQDIRVTIVQPDLYWEDWRKNLEVFSLKLSQLQEKTDLIALPEMFTTGFSMNAEKLAQEMKGPSIEWLTKAASQSGCVVVASLIIKERGYYYNRLIWMRPDGTFSTYDKRHLFRMAGEHCYFAAGKERLIVELKGWKFCPLICYDLRFPVWCRNRGDYDCLIFIANWPESRKLAWRTLLRARAIENQAYVVGVNRIGKDGNGLLFSGDSMAIDPEGKVLSKTRSYTESIETVLLDAGELDRFRKEFQVSADADDFIFRK